MSSLIVTFNDPSSVKCQRSDRVYTGAYRRKCDARRRVALFLCDNRSRFPLLASGRGRAAEEEKEETPVSHVSESRRFEFKTPAGGGGIRPVAERGESIYERLPFGGILT